MGYSLDRCHNGETRRVWEELLALGKDVQQEPLLQEAQAVATETMRRVRQNVELLLPLAPGSRAVLNAGFPG